MGKGDATAFMSKQRKRIANVCFTIKFSNYLFMAVLQALPAVCRGIMFENKIFKLLIDGSTASITCSMQGYKMKNSKNLNCLSGWREHIWMINF